METFARFFITSRPFLNLEPKFSFVARIDVSAHDHDLQTYLESAIEESSRMSLYITKDERLKVDIIESVIKKAAGMYVCKQTLNSSAYRDVSLTKHGSKVSARPPLYCSFVQTNQHQACPEIS